MRNVVENGEDDSEQAGKELQQFHISEKDVLVGIAASGTTPYVLGGVKEASENGLITGCITNNRNSLLAKTVHYPIEVEVGHEFVTGSTRMKAGNAQKLVLNIISTSYYDKTWKGKGQ